MKLTIIRHAHAQRRGISDHARVLSPQGHRQVQELRPCLHDVIQPDIVLHSDAARTTETAQLLDFNCDYLSLPELYSAGVEGMVDAVVEYGKDSTVVVGHEPTVSAVAAFLSGSDEFFGGVPTATAIILEGEAVQAGMSVVDRFVAPRR
ncbi:MAG: histidine phosphatase family protein [Actinomycetaceae bacterium]|nr:histidine phosphatase family protein [Actinomycetaceae bacterium]